MAIPGLTYRLENNDVALTHTEMDNNFRSVIYSSSIQDGGDTLFLHFDSADEDHYTIPLNGGSGGLTISNNSNNSVVTATGQPSLLQGESDFSFDSDTGVVTIIGRINLGDGDGNILIGEKAGLSIGGDDNILIGDAAGKVLEQNNNTAVGNSALTTAVNVSNTVAFGDGALDILTVGNNNVSLGTQAGGTLASGTGNIHLGYSAGPVSTTTESNKLYINNAASVTPLILGDFSTGHLTVNSTVSASVFSGSYYGDGSNLTGLTAAAEWDGSRDGNADITGSLIVSGTTNIVDFTSVAAISGSIFSGSFVGDGSGLTGVQATVFPYTGDAKIIGSLAVNGASNVTGSFIVSGSTSAQPNILLKGATVIDKNIHVHNGNTCNYNNSNIGIGNLSLYRGACETLSNGTIYKSDGNIAIGEMAVGGVRYASYSSNTGQYSGIKRRLLGNTAVGDNSQCGLIAGSYNTSLGYKTMKNGGIGYNVAIGSYSMANGANRRSMFNVAMGFYSLASIDCAQWNVVLGGYSGRSIKASCGNTLLGSRSGEYITETSTGSGTTIIYAKRSNCNTAVGFEAGRYLGADSCKNVYLGSFAGPPNVSPKRQESNKLYINNARSLTPLILGDFNTGQVTINSQVSASIFSGSFVGNGSNLTGIEWDGSRNGNADITGSLVVSGSTSIVDFTDVVTISGSIFSGSFVGDGSGLTGVTSDWDGTHNGNAEITGSLIVSGTLDIADTVTIASTGYPGGPGIELIHFQSSSLAGNLTIHSFNISSTGYTGFKADYSLSTNDESEKKIGTLLGSWDGSGGETINDVHTIATGDIIGTSFSIDSNGSTALLKLDADTGNYDVNMLITAFKRQV